MKVDTMGSSAEISISEINLEPHQFPYYGVPTRYEDEQRLIQFIEDHHINCDSPRFKFCPHINIDELKELISSNESAVLDMPSGTGQTRLLQEMRNFCSETRTCVFLSSELLSTSDWEKVSDNQIGVMEWIGKQIITGLLSKDVPVFLPTHARSNAIREKQFLSWCNGIIRTVRSVSNSKERIWIFMDEPKSVIDQDDWFLHLKRCIDIFEKFKKMGIQFLIACSTGESLGDRIKVVHPIFPKYMVQPLLADHINFITSKLKILPKLDDEWYSEHIQENDVVNIKGMLSVFQKKVHEIMEENRPNPPKYAPKTITTALNKYINGPYARSIPKIISFESPDALGGGIFLLDEYILTALHVIAKNPTSSSVKTEEINRLLRSLLIRFKGNEDFEFDPIYPKFTDDGFFQPPALDVALLKLLPDRGHTYKKRNSMLINPSPAIRPQKPLAILYDAEKIESLYGVVRRFDEANIYHDIPVKVGCSGSAIIGEDDKVIALHIEQDNYGFFKALSIGAIMDHLRITSDSDTQNYKDLKEFINKWDNYNKLKK